MSLLEKASIITTPTAYGVGVLNSIKPAYALGNNLLTENWTTTGVWVFTNNGTENATLSKASTDATNCRQTNIGLVSNRTYKLEFTISVYNSGSLAVKFGGGIVVQIENESVGKFSLDLLNDGNLDNIQLQGTFQGTIEQIRLREITDADFDFARTSTATRVNPDYLIETVAANIPRLDYSNGVAQILVENASTNLVTYSEDFEGSGWTDFNVTLTSGQSSPDGNSNAYLIEPTNSSFLLYAQSTVIASTEYKFSYFFKSGTKDAVKIAFYNDTANSFIETNATQSFVDYGNGWKKIITTVTTPSGCTSLYSYIDRSSEVGTFYAWGAQLEQGSYATSYIPTSGTTVTRAAETLNNAGNSDLFNDNAGTLYCEIAALSDDGTRRGISISDGTATDNTVRISFHSVSNTIRAQIRVGGSLVASMSELLTDTKDYHKVALSYKENEARLYIDGAEVGTDDILPVPVGLNVLAFSEGGTSNPFYGKCKTVAVFKEALSASEMTCLTSTGNREIFLNYYYRMHYVGANIEALSCAEKTFNV
jgi:hypothetical protein